MKTDISLKHAWNSYRADVLDRTGITNPNAHEVCRLSFYAGASYMLDAITLLPKRPDATVEGMLELMASWEAEIKAVLSVKDRPDA